MKTMAPTLDRLSRTPRHNCSHEPRPQRGRRLDIETRIDNVKATVASVIGFSRQRVEADRWTAFRSHYGIEAFYCQPGIQAAHEKGSVEAQIGWFRRNHLVPIPEVDSLADPNAMVDAWDVQDDARWIGSRACTVGERFATEQALLAPLPTEPFETGRWFNPRVDRHSNHTCLSSGGITAMLHGTALPPCEAVEELVTALHAEAAPMRPLWDAARAAAAGPPPLPPAFEAFCALHRDCDLDYARAHLPESDARRAVSSALGELAIRWPHIVSHLNPAARVWTLLSARIRTQRPVPPPLSDCPTLHYDALVLHCLLDCSSSAAAEVMGQDPNKIRYVVCSAPAQSRTAVRRLALVR
jgi:hypothetical protein